MKYRYHWLFKLTAMALAVVSGAALMLGAAGLLMADSGLYEGERRGQFYSRISGYCYSAAEAVFDRFAWQDTGIEPKLFERFFRWGADVDAAQELEYDFCYIIRDSEGTVVDSNCSAGIGWDWVDYHTLGVWRGYVTEMPKAQYYPTFHEFSGIGADSGMVYVDLTGAPLPPLGENVTDTEYYVVSEADSVNPQNISMQSYHHADADGADYTIYRMEYTSYEAYAVEIGMTAEQMAAMTDISIEQEFLPQYLNTHRRFLAPMVIWGGIGLLAAILWLALAAGRSPGREDIRPEGLNLIPLDLWLAAAAVAALGIIVGTAACLESMVFNSVYGNYTGLGGKEFFLVETGLLGLCGGGAGLIAALLLMACAAQMKKGGGYWLRHTAVALCWQYGWKLLKKIGAGLKNLCSRAFGISRRFVKWIPLTWQWLIAAGVLWIMMVFCCIVGIGSWEPWLILLGAALTAVPVFYGAYCFGALRDGAKKMSGGNLEEKLESKYLYGCFGEFAGHLNALGDACTESARQQMKSERMKTELITNVSHDIKTPLTSIINYVDLLQKTGDEQERRDYLEVLDRQSQRLKKLIKDLMDMSRANSGNVSVEITPTDVCEAVSQALGEFADPLEKAGLKVMLKTPDEPLLALCDGRHLWRVLSNCLSNVVKYAMPGTRVYVEAVNRGRNVEISIKNISAQMLNITAEELMERFVRGDSSRNTEGNGLGLNIARSLMELQGGRLELSVDGDLFKVVLTLNAA